jgi:hypothetical protein
LPASATASPAPEILGKTTPRLWTRPLDEGEPGPCGCGCALTPETSVGFAVVAFAVLIGRPLDPWQRWLVIHGMELLPNGWPRFRQLVVLVARQNGKTELLVILSLFWLWVEQVGMVLGTSTKLDYSRESWMKALTLARKSPDLGPDIAERGAVRKTNGEQEIICPWGSRYKIAAANEEGGRSLTVDRLIEDELRQHHDWSAHTAANNAMNAVSNAQAWAITNEGDDRAIVLHTLYEAALAFINTGEGDRRLGLFAWSAPAGCDLLDVVAAAQANPNLGRRIWWENLEGEALRAIQFGGEVEGKYRTEVLCQRVRALKAEPVSWEAWAATSRKVNRDALVSPVFFVTISPEMRAATIATAEVLDGKPHVELADYRPGTGWLSSRLAELKTRYRGARFSAYAAGPMRSRVPELAEVGVDLQLDGSPESVAACAHVQKLAETLAFTHGPDEVVADSLKGLVWKTLDGAGTAIDWKHSKSDPAPFAAVAGALWLLETQPSYDVLSSVL